MPKFPPGQTLLIDADDTLWENNVYFERAIAAFIGYLNHHEYSPAEVRETLNAVERETILAMGMACPASLVRWSPALYGSARSQLPKKKLNASSASQTQLRSKISSCCMEWRKPLLSYPSVTGSFS